MGRRRVLITGASRGIGRAIALAFATPDAELWLNYRARDDDAKTLKDACEHKGAAVELLRFDVGNEAEVRAALSGRFDDPPLDVLVNNAGVTIDGLLAMMPFDDWRKVCSVNLDGMCLVSRAVLGGMLRARRGCIVNVTSISGERGNRGQVAYSTTKAGIIGFTKALALEVAKRGITVNAVSPGFIQTEMTEKLPRAELEAEIPLGRFGLPDEVASVVRFLASQDASYVTGQVLSVNGGLYT